MSGILRKNAAPLWKGSEVLQKTVRSATSIARTPAETASYRERSVSIPTRSALEASHSSLFYRSVGGRLREAHKRATRKLRQEGLRIPGFLEGRGKIPDMLLEIPMAPLFEDLRKGMYALQKRGKTKLSGPLYELRVETGTFDEYGNLLDTSHVPFERIRVLPHNMEIHPLTERPVSVSLRFSPEDEPVRVRVPIRCINEEKSKGLREGGWLNRLHWYVDINVAPYTKAPLYATLDVADMDMKDRRTIGDLQFDGKGEGCRAVLLDDVATTMISPV